MKRDVGLENQGPILGDKTDVMNDAGQRIRERDEENQHQQETKEGAHQNITHAFQCDLVESDQKPGKSKKNEYGASVEFFESI